MKTNAPEKIYLQENTTTDCYGEFWQEWFEARLKDTDVEYTRTDAFVEKACNLLMRMVWEVTYEGLEGNSINHHDKMKFIEDFRKYMKGE